MLEMTELLRSLERMIEHYQAEYNDYREKEVFGQAAVMLGKVQVLHELKTEAVLGHPPREKEVRD